MIYWDHNATTPLRPEVAALLQAALGDRAPSNPSSVHQAGRAARQRMERARQAVARVLGAEPRELVFTGSGTEADALCVKGAYQARRDPSRDRIVVSAIEHHAVLQAAAQLEARGAKVTRVAPERSGRVSVAAMVDALGPDVALCSLQWANNETGVVQPVREVARICRERGVLFHTDAVQAAGKLPVNLREVDADLLSLSGHKLGAPAGVGACVIRRGVAVEPLTAGHQEGGRRGGTEGVLLQEAFARALELADAELDTYRGRLEPLRDSFEALCRARLGGVEINGAGAPRVPNTSSVLFDAADGEALLIALDLAGICASTGAACASGTLAPSHVLIAMGRTSAQAHGSLRFSLGADATAEQVERVVAVLEEHLGRARSG